MDRLKSKGIRLASVPQVRGLPHSQDPKLNSHSKLNCIIACLQAEAAGVDVSAWKACVAEPSSQVEEITSDFEDGRALGVSGTPAFFVNGIFLNGAVPKDQFVTLIERELSGG